MLKEAMEQETSKHPFERAGLGKAPFSYAGMTEKRIKRVTGQESRCGSSCDYCSTGITYEFWIVSSDNKKFKVGSDCIAQLLDPSDKLAKIVAKAAKEAIKETKKKKTENKVDKLPSLMTEKMDVLKSKPHPNQFFASKGASLYDYYEYMIKMSRNTGKTKIYKQLLAC